MDTETLIEEWGNQLHAESLVERDDWFIKQCRDKSVLHLACTDAAFTADKVNKGTALHLKIENVCSTVTGVDIEGDALETLAKVCSSKSSLVHCDVESSSLLEKLPTRDYDVIVFADIIEHLNNPGCMVQNIKLLMNPETQLIVSKINAYALKLVCRAMVLKEAVHPDHVVYYSYATLLHLFERYGIRITGLWTFTYPFKNKILTNLQCRIYKLFPTVADGIIVQAKLNA